MKRTIFSALAFVAVLAVALSAFAQPGGGPGGPGGRGPGGPGGPGGFDVVGGLIRNEAFKKELNLTEEQISSLTKLAEAQRNNQPPRGERRDGPPSREDFQKMREEFEKRADETLGKVNQILSPEQQGKFKELRFKLAGGLNARGLNARTLEVVNLTEEQKTKLKAIQEEQEKEGMEAFEKMGNVNWRELSQEEREKRGNELRTEGEARQKKYAEKIKGILTPEQLKKAEDLTAGVQETREKLGFRGRDGGGDRERRDGGVPNSWQPGQGGQRRDADRQQRRAFPQQEQKSE